ncbi:MAG: hypothetical protein ACKOUT_07270 [Novosphingobium sp.]
MKKIVMIAAAISAVSASPAMAATYDVKATVGAFCSALTGSATDLDFTALSVDAAGKLTDARSLNSTQASVVCNGAATTITVNPTAMVGDKTLTDTANFTKTINYTATATLGSASVSTTTVTGSVTQGIHEQAGTLTVSAGSLSAAGNKALLAGSYAGTITVTFTPGA